MGWAAAVKILQIHTAYRQPSGEDAVVRGRGGAASLGRTRGDPAPGAEPPGNLRAAGALALSAWNPFAARAVRALAERHHPDVAHVHKTGTPFRP